MMIKLKNNSICCLFMLILVVTAIFNFPVKAAESKIRVMAAASLTEMFTELAEEYEVKSGVEVECNFAGSQALYSQLIMGVGADVFASANIKYMDQLKDSKLVEDPKIFAENKLIAAVNKESGIDKFSELALEKVKLVIADESVPVGSYTIQMLNKEKNNSQLDKDFKEKFMNNVVSKEVDVKSVVNKVYLGEVDAGIVYQTDITPKTAEKLKVIEIEDNYNVTASYPIAVLNSSHNKKEALNFIEYIYSDAGGKILDKYGFTKVGSD
ncbi:molybdate transport system substrate-binding protein [Halanaerobium saccharolyticum]|uniref:Molybdate transport system substrate-binding protein n=1 Tax=Halanaerobium saccharolyticum TaxID=43595 RepID=A0A4R7ZBD8_9FIRM|nr:molybdate ABC transporter substrate-binding protein [Halanaerobium saccharolyticum]RAK11795.1 molybdate transport system substrate-binding protein [Halanaerobium saccharolyticum]TDW07636.1 molybdate transport system substrate-binding protein [Halanaerobium saccharolyticum]TDX64557.1 molybdate transport system substrate-binding protein [Halanaerobium saccharolyticum]